MHITKELREWLEKSVGLGADADDGAARLATGQALQSKRLTVKTLASLTRSKRGDTRMTTSKVYSPAAVFGGEHIRVKDASEAYSSTRTGAKHFRTGEPIFDPIHRHEAEHASRLEQAKAGVFLRVLALKTPGMGNIRPLDEHERSLWTEMLERDTWAGDIGGEYYNSIPGLHVKAVLSDSVSGGLNVNPLWFDENLVTFPLLHGELFPFVDLVEMPRSNVVQSGSIGNPTVTWGIGEGAAVTMFNTTALVGPVGSTVQNVMVAVEVGRDFLSDAAADVGTLLVSNIGQRMQSELDRVIALGNGSTEPAGILGTSGLTVIPSDNSGNGPWTVGDAEGLAFGVPKQYRDRALNPSFIANDISYRRMRAIPVGPGDERRVFGMNHNDYTLLDWPFRISQSIGNGSAAFAALKKYRLWRRLGFETRWSLEGSYLMSRNIALLTVRGRFAGKVIDPASATLISDGEA
jgi:hypothetical protein